MIDICFSCGKEMEWAVDDYFFKWVSNGTTTSGVRPFCYSCKPEHRKKETQPKSKSKKLKTKREVVKSKKSVGPEQLTLDI